MKIREVPSHLDPVTRQFLKELRETVMTDRGSSQSPEDPHGIKVVPAKYANVMTFSGPSGAKFIVYAGDSGALDLAAAIDIRTSTRYVDYVGVTGKTRYYWVKAANNSGESKIVGPQKATTL